MREMATKAGLASGWASWMPLRSCGGTCLTRVAAAGLTGHLLGSVGRLARDTLQGTLLNADHTTVTIAHWLRSVIVELSEGRLAIDEIDSRRHMVDCGYIDSLSAVVLLARVEDKWAVDVDDNSLFSTATTVDDLASLISERCRL